MPHILPNGQNLRIREAVADDAAALLKMFRQAVSETDFLMSTPEEAGKLRLEYEKSFIYSYQKNDNQLFLLAEADHSIAGTLSLTQNKWKKQQHVLELGIVVLRKYWNMGIARRMINYMFHWVERQSLVRYIYLHVMANNEKAIRMYQNFGFEEEGRMPEAVRLDKDNYQDVVLMGKRIK